MTTSAIPPRDYSCMGKAGASFYLRMQFLYKIQVEIPAKRKLENPSPI